MTRLGGPAVGAAAFALTAGLACDAGGFESVSLARALVLLGAAALLLAILATVELPGRFAGVQLAALGLLTAWTAASWLWSDSPPQALVEAQRTALYLGAALAVVLVGRRATTSWIAAGVVGGATLAAVWNLVTRARGVAHPRDTGALAEPVGYANGLALLCVLGLLLLPALPRVAWVLVVPLAVDLWKQDSAGALVALAAGALAYAFVVGGRARRAAAVLAIAGVAAAPFLLGGHEREHYWRVAVQEARANPLLGSGAGTFHVWWLRERTVPFSTLDAHSLYLETLAELGPPGLALLLVALAAPLAAAVRLRRPELVAALVAYDVAAAFDFHWELAGVTAPAVLLGASAAAQASTRRREVRRVVTVPALALLTAAALLAYAGDAHLAAGKSALARGDRARAAAEARAALRWAPFSSEAWGLIGDAESNAAAYRRALDLDPDQWSLWQRLAEVSSGAPRRFAMHEATRLNPLAIEP